MTSIYYSEKRDKICSVEACSRPDTFRVYAIRTSTKELDYQNLETETIMKHLLDKEYELIGYV